MIITGLNTFILRMKKLCHGEITLFAQVEQIWLAGQRKSQGGQAGSLILEPVVLSIMLG